MQIVFGVEWVTFASWVHSNFVPATPHVSVAPGSPRGPTWLGGSWKVTEVPWRSTCSWSLASPLDANASGICHVAGASVVVPLPCLLDRHLGCVHNWLLRTVPLMAFTCQLFWDVCFHLWGRSAQRCPLAAPQPVLSSGQVWCLLAALTSRP